MVGAGALVVVLVGAVGVGPSVAEGVVTRVVVVTGVASVVGAVASVVSDGASPVSERHPAAAAHRVETKPTTATRRRVDRAVIAPPSVAASGLVVCLQGNSACSACHRDAPRCRRIPCSDFADRPPA